MDGSLDVTDVEKGLATVKTNLKVPSGGEIQETAEQTHDGSYEERLYNYVVGSADDRLSFMEFRVLQRLNLVELQNELARIKVEVWSGRRASADAIEKLRTSMHAYVTAIRDLEYFQKLGRCDAVEERDFHHYLTAEFSDIAIKPADPYNTRYRFLEDPVNSARYDLLRDSLRKMLPCSLAYSKEEKKRRISQYLMKNPPVQLSPFVDRLARFIIAFISGASLIVPMIVMRLHGSLIKSLVTTCAAVVIVAAFLTFVIRASNSETMIVTAAYAAVLVVFVGVGS